ncbi:MAG: hypothetical protein WD342_19460 [Verrucomicrobiales bacterium]
MVYWKENENLERIERLTEEKVREMQRQLELGYEDAKSELQQLKSVSREAARRGIEKIDALADRAGEELSKVRTQLGRLNLLLAEEKIDDLETFDEFRDQILDQIDEARATLRRVETESGDEFQESRSELETA